MFISYNGLFTFYSFDTRFLSQFAGETVMSAYLISILSVVKKTFYQSFGFVIEKLTAEIT